MIFCIFPGFTRRAHGTILTGRRGDDGYEERRKVESCCVRLCFLVVKNLRRLQGKSEKAFPQIVGIYLNSICVHFRGFPLYAV